MRVSRAWEWFRRRLAWRLCALFVAGALLPVALSDWLVVTVMDGIADKLDADARTQLVRATSRQVLDRIRLGEISLQSLADSRDDASNGNPAFERLWCQQRGQPTQEGEGDSPLAEAWRRAAGDGPTRLRTRLALAAGADVRVLMGSVSPDNRLCVAVFRSEYLWEPLHNGSADAVWTVYDPSGRVLARTRDEDADEAPRRAGRWRAHVARLFMGGDGISQEWRFVQEAPEASVHWHGQPVTAWLGAVAAATLLTVALIGQNRIRRALAPLERLRAGTLRLAGGEGHARVEVRSVDEIGGLALAFNDMAEKLEERGSQLRFRAAHDDLTGLVNRFGLLQILESLLRDGTGCAELAVLFIDLDFFKDINDRHGHAVGDRVLCLTAQRLRQVDEKLVVARKGGDEFVIIVHGVGAGDLARTVAAACLATLAEPFVLEQGSHVCGASIGISHYPRHASAAGDLLRCADIALYESKRGGRGRFTEFDPSMDAEVRRRHDTLSALRLALANGELIVHFQPRISVVTGAIESAEALVRWERPGHGLVFPDQFIGLAETSGLIAQLGTEVLDRSLAQMARWVSSGGRVKRVSVNVSPRQFETSDFPQQVRAALRRHHLEPACLELEVTESVLSGDLADVQRQLVDLRAMGVTIAMDDFGTGYSSMALLRSLPIDVMKIDRAFVRDLETDASAMAIARTIVTLGRSLSLRLIAEGVETEGQAELLSQMGCDEFQGYLFGKPMPAAALDALLHVDPMVRTR